MRLRTNGELGQSAAQPLRDCLQLFQLRLLTPALLAQDLVLQPLVTLSKAQHTCSERRGPAHAAPASAGPRFQTSESVSWRLGYVSQNENEKKEMQEKKLVFAPEGRASGLSLTRGTTKHPQANTEKKNQKTGSSARHQIWNYGDMSAEPLTHEPWTHNMPQHCTTHHGVDVSRFELASRSRHPGRWPPRSTLEHWERVHWSLYVCVYILIWCLYLHTESFALVLGCCNSVEPACHSTTSATASTSSFLRLTFHPPTGPSR